MLQLRKWQEHALSNWALADRFLLEAIPGAGKTVFALEAARRMLESEKCQEIIWVVPSRHLVSQACDAASGLGLRLQPTENNKHFGGPVKGSLGQVVTYQQVSYWPELFAKRASKAFVVLDEAHHLGGEIDDDGALTERWGAKMERAFDHAGAMLLMTGTPWREDNLAIPFVNYDADGVLKPDYTYGFAKAWADKPSPIRQIEFPLWDAVGRWGYQSSSGVNSYEQRASETTSQKDERKVLNSLYDPASDWFGEVFDRANALLETARRSRPDAAGLVIARDVKTAEEYVTRIRQRGIAAEIIHAAKDGAHKSLSEFRGGTSPWLVSVKMVSEGVDIPRLEVLLYASSGLTELAFHQAVGRVIRRRSSTDNAVAKIVIPDSPTFRHLVEGLDAAKRHALREVEKLAVSEAERDEGQSLAFVLPATDASESFTIHKGEEITAAIRAFLETGNGLHEMTPSEQLGALELALEEARRLVESPPSVGVELTIEQREQKRKDNTKLANKIAERRKMQHSHVWNAVNGYFGHSKRSERSDEDLDTEKRLLEQWLMNGEVPRGLNALYA